MSKKILAFVMALVLVISLVPAVAAAETEIRFEFGANGNAAHVDGNDIGAGKTFTEGGYQLVLTDCSKVYDGAFDATGNSCLKLGTSKLPGAFTFAVPEDVAEIVIYAAKYKTYNTTLEVNGTAHTLTKNSNDGQYDEIVVDTSETKTVSVTTVTGALRTMIDAIVFKGVSGSGSTAPTVPEVTEPVVEPTEPVVVPTDPVEIVKEAYALAPNASLPYKATLTGKITSVKTAYDSNYNNVTVVIAVEGCEDLPITCYRLKGDGADQINLGDTITVSGTIVNYQHSSGACEVEFTAGCTLDSWVAGGSTEPTEPGGSTNMAQIVQEAYALEPGASLPYKATLTGTITEVKTPYDSNFNNVTVIIEVDGAEDMPITCFRLKGTGADKIGVGDTITVSGYITNYQHSSGDCEVEFTAGCTLDRWVIGGSTTPSEPEVTEPSVAPSEPEAEPTYGVVEAPKAGVAYKMGMNKNDGNILFFNGQTESASVTYRLATATDAAEAVDVYLEAVEGVEGGYRLYFISGETKTYIRVFHRTDGNPGYGKGSLELVTDVPAEYFIYDSVANTLVYDYDGNNAYYMGTYSTFTTFSVSNTSYITGDKAGNIDVSQYPARFYEVGAVEEPEVTQPTAPVDPEEMSVADAVALGEGLEHNQYTEEKYKITGTVAEISNAQYGNMYITDGNDNYLYIYGTYNADGTVAYGDMEVKPVAGDIVTIYGAIGNYNKAAQIKNGWIIEHIVGEPPVTEPVEEPDAVISFATTDNRLSQSATQQVWQQNGITVTNDKASSTTDIIDSSNPVRFYKNSKVTIEAAGMTKIVIACNNMQYADALVASVSAADGVTVSKDMSDVTIAFAEAKDSFTVETLSGGQVRVDSIGVYFAGGEEGVAGDMNADGDVNNDDVVLLLWHTLFPEDYPLNVNADLNSDGDVNNDDVVLLLWHTLFPEDYPL